MNIKKIIAISYSIALSSIALAQTSPIVNGTLDVADYGSALATQTQVTGFGQNTIGQIGFANGSQLDQVFGTIVNNELFVILTGNLEDNNNRLDLFFDTGATGQNTINGMSNTVRMNNWNGSTLSSGFNASTGITINGDGTTFYVNRETYNATTTSWTDVFGNGSYGVDNKIQNDHYAINNSNVGKSINSNDKTGIEFGISLADLGMSSAGSIKIIAGIDNNSGNYLSNQFLGGMTNVNNIGFFAPNGNTINLNNYGVKPFTVNPATPAPEPLPMALVFAGALIGIRKTRRG